VSDPVRIQRPARRSAGPEATIIHAIRERLGREPDLVLWRLGQGAGVLVALATLHEIAGHLRARRALEALELVQALINGARFARMGLVPGAADLIGILRTGGWSAITAGKPGGEPRVLGRFFAFEVKNQDGVVKPEQSDWHALVRSMGGFVAVVRSEADAVAALERARKGELQ